MTEAAGEADQVRVVLADANVIYARVLRDYLLYAADQEIIIVNWSAAILSEVTHHLIRNIPRFDEAAAERLIAAMNAAYPLAEIEPSEEAYARLSDFAAPDQNDRAGRCRAETPGGGVGPTSRANPVVRSGRRCPTAT